MKRSAVTEERPRRGRPPASKKRKQNDAAAELQPTDVAKPSPKTPKSTPPKVEKPTTDGLQPPEKRLKPYRHHAPQAVMIKHERVMSQRMFLVERSGRKNGALQEEFSVLGSTGNVYTVNVSMIPTYSTLKFM